MGYLMLGGNALGEWLISKLKLCENAKRVPMYSTTGQGKGNQKNVGGFKGGFICQSSDRCVLVLLKVRCWIRTISKGIEVVQILKLL